MKKWTKKQLEAEGYEIWNAEIKNVSLSMEDHACLVFYLSLDGHGPCCCYGGYVFGKGYVGAKTLKVMLQALRPSCGLWTRLVAVNMRT